MGSREEFKPSHSGDVLFMRQRTGSGFVHQCLFLNTPFTDGDTVYCVAADVIDMLVFPAGFWLKHYIAFINFQLPLI